jgi:putative heme-binding domain-containing protein
MYPARVDVAGVDLADVLAGGPAAGQAVKRVKEQLRRVPDKGLGYGLLRYLNPETAEQLADLFRHDRDPALRRAALKAIAGSKPESAAGFVGEIFKDAKANAALVPDAIAIAEKVNNVEMAQALADALTAGLPPETSVQTLGALSRMRGGRAVPVATALLADAGRPVEVRRAAAGVLGQSQSKDAVEPLLKAAAEPSLRREVTLALASIPDIRGLDAYLDGLDGKDGTVRQRCRDAIKQIAGQALPVIEAKLDRTTFSTQVMADLQAIFVAHQPVMEWQVLGPFPADAPDPFDVTSGFMPPRRPFKGANGENIRWRRVQAMGPQGMVDLGSDSNAVAYAWAAIPSDVDRPVQLLVGSDDTMVLWLNGKKLHEDPSDSGWNPEEATVNATLNKGRNILLLKVGNHGGGWQFSAAVSGERKGKLYAYDTKSLDPAVFGDFAMKHPGSAERGRTVFANTNGVNCVRCHQVNGQGGLVGPALTGVGVKYDRAKLIESVLYPSKQIFDGYQQTIVRMKDGKILNGAVQGETEAELTLMDAEGNKHVVRKSDITGRKTSELSLMPEGIHTGLKPEEFADLIAYLESLKEKPVEGAAGK